MSIVLLKNLNYIHFFIYCTSSNHENPGEDWVNIDRKKNKEYVKKSEIPCWLCNGLDYLQLFDPCEGRVKKCLV